MTNQHERETADRREDFSDTPIIPGPDNPDPDGLFIAEVQGRNKRLRQLIQFTHSSTKAAAIMLVAAIIALIVANTPAHGPSSSSGTRKSPSASGPSTARCRLRTSSTTSSWPCSSCSSASRSSTR